MATIPSFDSSQFFSDSWLDESECINAPQQERGRQTLIKILVAAKKLFLSKGFDETTIMEISRLSGISVGSIYHRFPDKTAIFLAIHEAYRKARIEQIDEAIARQKRAIQSAVDVLSFHVGIVFDAARNDQIYLRLVERQRISNPLVNDLQLQWDDDFCKKLLSLYLPHKKQIKHPDLEQAIRYLHHTLRGVTLWSILPSPSPHQFLNVDQEDFQEQAYRMSAMYLGIKVSSTRARAAP